MADDVEIEIYGDNPIVIAYSETRLENNSIAQSHILRCLGIKDIIEFSAELKHRDTSI